MMYLRIFLSAFATIEAWDGACIDGCDGLEENPVSLLQTQTEVAETYEHPPWITECQSIFLDAGSNEGVQIRKLYEPEKFPGALLLETFNTTFGSAEERRRPGSETG